ncbi:MAG: hypothetical protein SFU84_00120 [Gemmatimonadales bacterium]|nr:hypothetical protein [Gemmatimonadales bacterium]
METSYSRAGLLQFLDTLGTKGLANANTVQSMKVACGKILVDLSDAEEADVRGIDVGLAVRKFNNKNPGKLSPSSLSEYQRRVTLAIREFDLYQGNPTGYKGIGRGPTAKQEGGEKSAPRKREGTPREAGKAESQPPSHSPPATPTSGLSFAFPLRQDFLAQLVVPRDMKLEEAQRLCAFVRALAVDITTDK